MVCLLALMVWDLLRGLIGVLFGLLFILVCTFVGFVAGFCFGLDFVVRMVCWCYELLFFVGCFRWLVCA